MSRENHFSVQVFWTYSKKKKINVKNTYQRHFENLKIGVVLDNLKQSEDWYGLVCWRSTGVNPMDIQIWTDT
jgi:hypothetical protein